MSAEVLVIGGGLTGMALALGLEHRGTAVRVLERLPPRRSGGAGISVDRGLLGRLTGRPCGDLPVERDPAYDFAAWHDVYAWLSARVERSTIAVEHRRPVEAVRTTATAADVRLSDGTARSAPLVIGADGVRSVVRRHVEPERARAESVGYLVWRGMVPEGELPAGTPLPAAGRTLEIRYDEEFVLFAYAVPGPDGSTAPGERRLVFNWTDPRRHDLLVDAPGLADGSFAASAQPAVPPALLAELAASAAARWPTPWDTAIPHAIASGRMVATPVADHLPGRLVRGRAALVGDAAHAVTPFTGAGLYTALQGALALARAIERHGPAPAALAAYEAERLAPSRRLVQSGRRASRAFLESALA